MSASRFALFCIVLFFFGSVHQFDARGPYCYREHDSKWCCNSKPKQCRSIKVECDAICKPKRHL
ncbi:unnamed protein product [Brassica oleracea]